jgi:hypothetical protein
MPNSVLVAPGTTGACTTCATLSVLPRKFLSPTYCAVTAFVPNGREAVPALMPPLTSALVANGVPLAEKTIFPVGRSAAGTPFTAAVNVMFVPGPDGFIECQSDTSHTTYITPQLKGPSAQASRTRAFARQQLPHPTWVDLCDSKH